MHVYVKMKIFNILIIFIFTVCRTVSITWEKLFNLKEVKLSSSAAEAPLFYLLSSSICSFSMERLWKGRKQITPHLLCFVGGIKSLQDSHDFHPCAVWCMRAAAAGKVGVKVMSSKKWSRAQKKEKKSNWESLSTDQFEEWCEEEHCMMKTIQAFSLYPTTLLFHQTHC